jgi:hypothetical protein
MDKIQAYSAKEKEAALCLRLAVSNRKHEISLVPKNTTHVMRKRLKKPILNLRKFNQVIRIDVDRQEAEIEGCTRFYDVAKETLKYGLIPKVVPEFRGITVGGTVSGLGLESSSFKHGIVQETLKDITLLTGSGVVLTFTPNTHSDLWNALPNSFGSLGYVLKCTVSLIKAKKYVQVTTVKFSDPVEYFERMNAETTNPRNDFVDGVIFAENECVLILGVMVDAAPVAKKSLNLITNIYYEKIRSSSNGESFYLNISDYLFRWDKDAFWGMESYPILKLFFHNKFLRATILKPFLRTDRLLSIKKKRDWLFDIYNKFFGGKTPIRFEELIQDFGIDIRRGAEFVSWYNKKLPIYPLWVCPLKKMVPRGTYPLFDFSCDMILDMGFYAKTALKNHMADNHYLKMGEQKLHEMEGMKGLYSRNAYTPDEFWDIYDKDAYFSVKNKYDPHATFPDVYRRISIG